MTAALPWLYDEIVQQVQPPKQISCWDWNRQHGRLTSRDSANPGPLTLEKTPYWSHWYDLISARSLGRRHLGDLDPYAHLTEQIWVVKGVQIGGTRMLMSALSWWVDQHPGPMGYVLPDKVDFLDVQSERLRPLFEETPALERHFPQTPKLQQTRLTKRRWTLDTMPIYFLAGNNRKDARSRPLRLLGFDEFDLLTRDCEGDGDPIKLYLARQNTFERTKLALGITSPTWVDGHGWQRLCSGSHERLLVQCRFCGVHQQLKPTQLAVLIDDQILSIPEAIEQAVDPELVKMRRLGRWRCEGCGGLHLDREKQDLITEASLSRRYVPGTWELSPQHPQGRWTPHGDFTAGRLTQIHISETTIRTGHINSLYSPFISFSRFAAEDISVGRFGDQDQKRAHRNTWHAEPSLVDEQAPPPEVERITVQSLPRGQAPAWVQHVMICCDQQENTVSRAWFPYVVRGIGAHGRLVQLDEGRVDGFEGVAKLEARQWWVGGDRRVADVTAMDGANGNMAVYVQQWASENASRRVVLQGRDGLAVPVLQRHNKGRKAGKGRRMLDNVRAWYFEPNAWKTALDDRIRNATSPLPSPLIPTWERLEDARPDYLASLGSECQIRLTDRRGKLRLVWRPREMQTAGGQIRLREDTHWWDAEMMALVLAHVLGWDDLPDPVGQVVLDARPRERDQALEFAVNQSAGDWVGGSSW